jgi:hypothetical protein
MDSNLAMEISTPQHPQPFSNNICFVDTKIHTHNLSYSSFTKSAVFSQWHKSLQKQQYEEACHWTAELDASQWHKDIWQKLILFASKHVHLHCPKLPLIVARNFAYYNIHLIKNSLPDTVATQPRNIHQLQKNLCQVIGLVTLCSKGPVYTLPSVDIHKVDGSELVSGTHPWLMSCKHAQDDASVLRIMSTLLCQLEARNTHKLMYWLGVLTEYDKHQKQQTEPIQMAARKPILPDDNSYKHVFVNGTHACDWVWLLWHAIAHGCRSLGKPKECVDTIKALGYLFAHDYTSSKRNSRLPILVHALQLVYTNVQWQKSVYSGPNEKLIDRACQNIHLLYKDIRDKRHQHIAQPPTAPTTTGKALVQQHTHPQRHTQATNDPKPNPNPKPKTTHASKNTVSTDSYTKLDTFDKIDALFLGL